MDAYHGSCRLSASEERLSDTVRRSTIVARVQSGECVFISFRYDADANHEPCLKQGHRAHWLLAHGYLKELDSSNNNEHDLVLVQHGKSKFLGAFSLADLFRSNNQLLEADPKRRLPSEYCLPTDASLRETLGSLFISVAEKWNLCLVRSAINYRNRNRLPFSSNNAQRIPGKPAVTNFGDANRATSSQTAFYPRITACFSE